MLTVYLDRLISRRKKAHFIAANEDEPMFWSQEFGQCLEWLHENEHSHFNLDVDGKQWTCTIQKTHNQREANNG